MKNIVVFVLLSIAFFSCRENQVASEQMDRAETLLPVYPDSAYVILEGVELPDKLNERQFARWCMLYCRAADKLFKDMLYAEQLDRALGWYKSHGTAEEQACTPTPDKAPKNGGSMKRLLIISKKPAIYGAMRSPCGTLA